MFLDHLWLEWVKINSWISDLVTAKNLWSGKKKKQETKKSYLASSYLVS